MKTIKLLLLSCILVFTASCDDDDSNKTKLPKVTTIGANTFGCVVDGVTYVSGKHKREIMLEINGILHKEPISFIEDTEENKVYVNVVVKPSVTIGFTILNPEEGKVCLYEDAYIKDLYLGNRSLPGGAVEISRFDAWSHIISGTFSGGTMTEGRFDVIYNRNLTNP